MMTAEDARHAALMRNDWYVMSSDGTKGPLSYPQAKDLRDEKLMLGARDIRVLRCFEDWGDQ